MKKGLHRTQIIALDTLKRFEREKLEVHEGLMVVAIMIRTIGLTLGMGPRKIMGLIQRMLIRLAEVSKVRESKETIWTPHGIGLDA